MSKNRIIFYLTFLAFHVGAFIFTLAIQNFEFLTSIFKHISLFKYVTFLGIILMLTDIIWSWIVSRDSQKENAALTHELNTLKAKLFDLQEKSKEMETAKNVPKIK
ncbi:MAG: hypothetical protein ABIS36_16840 [Chryseolinea sp.]